MGLESEIERLFHEAQDWDMEMLVLSALPTYHSNYPSSPPPDGYQNTSLSWAPKTTLKTGVFRPSKDALEISLDKDYFLVDRLVLYKVDDNRAERVGKQRIESLRKIHKPDGPNAYKDHLDEVSAAVAKPAPSAKDREHALEHLKGEGVNHPITIKLYDSVVPADGKSATAEKVVITFKNCDYILKDRQQMAHSLQRRGKLEIPVAGFADRWPREIEIRDREGRDGHVYVRADIALPGAKKKKPVKTVAFGRIIKRFSRKKKKASKSPPAGMLRRD